MAQIQKEEEARKRRAAAAAANAQASAMSAVANPAGGKSYANLAGKITSPPPNPAPGGAWTTVGAGGKAKTPVAASAPAINRSVSSGAPPAAAATAVKKAPSRASTLNTTGTVNALEEFKKWAAGELRPDLKGLGTTTAEDVVNTLCAMPPDVDMLREAVHSVSTTIDSRHFAEEFMRRKKLADKGLVDLSAPPKSASPANAGGPAGGWSEVAKKGPVKDTTPAGAVAENGSFRVVSKKKGGKR
jgi:PERQ amino acid-rich with GYF domain-containing protein